MKTNLTGTFLGQSCVEEMHAPESGQQATQRRFSLPAIALGLGVILMAIFLFASVGEMLSAIRWMKEYSSLGTGWTRVTCADRGFQVDVPIYPSKISHGAYVTYASQFGMTKIDISSKPVNREMLKQSAPEILQGIFKVESKSRQVSTKEMNLSDPKTGRIEFLIKPSSSTHGSRQFHAIFDKNLVSIVFTGPETEITSMEADAIIDSFQWLRISRLKK